MLSNNWMKSWTRQAIELMTIVALTLFAVEAGASVPTVVVYSHTTVSSTGLGSSQNSIALDACGNMYTIQQGTGNVYETPVGGGAAQLLYTGFAPSWSGDILIYINPAKTYAFISEGFGGSSQVARIPITNCSLQTGQLTSVTNGFSNGWTASGAVTTDAAGDIFYSNWAGNGIIETSADLNTQTKLLAGLSALPTGLAVDSQNNLYYAIGSSIYELTYSGGAYSTTPITFSTGYISVVGLTFDGAGNLYVTDAGTQYANDGAILVIPNETNGSTAALNPSDQYTAAGGPANSWSPVISLNLSAAVALDGQGNIYYEIGDSTINKFIVGKVNFGSLTIGNTSTATIYAEFNASVTPAAIKIISNNGAFKITGGTCAASTSYTAGEICTITASFTPGIPGVAESALTLTDSSGDVLGSAFLSGTGIGAGLTIDPGTLNTSFGSGYTAPAGAAVDNLGNVFFADSSQNVVLEVPAGASASAAVPLGSGLKAPNGVAVDGAGNVYVADTGNSQIVEIPVVNGALSTSAQTTLISSSTVVAGSALSNPAGIAVDSLGNLYIADSGNKRVVYVPYADSLVLSFATTLGSGMSSPSAITVDASGNVYVADEGNGDVYELTAPLSAGAQATVASGYNKPSGLAVDASGALFVVDQGNQAIWRVPNISGNLTQASAVNVVGQLDPSTESQIVKDPYGVAIDSIGNLYVSDNKNATVYQVNRIAGTQFLGYWNPGSTSTDGSVSLESSGNAALTLNSPFYSLSGDTAEFTALTSETNACASGSVASGSSCSLEATFTPAALTSNSEIYTLSSNAANSTSQQVTFSGTGLPTAATTTAVAITSPTGAISYDQSVTVQVTVASVDSSNGIPSGKVQFLLDGSVKQTVVLDNKGTASYTFPGGPLIPGGSQAFSAVYLGAITPNFAYSQSTSAPLNVTVQTVATSNTLSFATAFINPASQAAGTSITFTATITSTFAGTPTGKVTFVVTDAAGGTPVSLPVLIGSTNGGVATATYTLPAPISSVYDVISVVATYSGDANFAGSTSAVETFNLAPTFSSSPGSVSLTASGTSITSGISSGGNITFTPTSQGGWNGLVGFSCLASSLPEYTQCVWSPGQVQLGPSTTGKVAYQPTVTLSIAINQPPQTPTASKLVWWIGGLTGLVLLFARRRWMRKGLASFAMLVGVILLGVSATGLTACNNTDNIPFASPIGSKTITVLVSSDPFSSPPTFSTPIPSTKPCGINPTTNLHDSTLAPCTQQTYQVNVSVQ